MYVWMYLYVVFVVWDHFSLLFCLFCLFLFVCFFLSLQMMISTTATTVHADSVTEKHRFCLARFRHHPQFSVCMYVYIYNLFIYNLQRNEEFRLRVCFLLLHLLFYSFLASRQSAFFLFLFLELQGFCPFRQIQYQGFLLILMFRFSCQAPEISSFFPSFKHFGLSLFS